jgi:PleD family two-component response regulator
LGTEVTSLRSIPPCSSRNLATELCVFAGVAALLASLRQRLESESEKALTDHLTRLKNRRALQRETVKCDNLIL